MDAPSGAAGCLSFACESDSNTVGVGFASLSPRYGFTSIAPKGRRAFE